MRAPGACSTQFFRVPVGKSMGDLASEMRSIRMGIEAVLRRMEGRLTRPVALSMEDAAASIGLGLTKFSELVRRKEISTFRVDRRRLVRTQELEDWAARQSTPVLVRMPKTRGRTEGEKIRAALKRA